MLEFDNVANDQRKTIYELRNAILDGEDISERLQALRHGVVEDIFRAHVPAESLEEQWDLKGLHETMRAELNLHVDVEKMMADAPSMSDDDLLRVLTEAADDAYRIKNGATPADVIAKFERWSMLEKLDHTWREHLAALDHLRQGIHLRGYAQKNPKQEYKREAFELFGELLESIKLETTRQTMLIRLKSPEEVAEAEARAREEEERMLQRAQFQHASIDNALASPEPEDNADVAVAERPKAQPFQRVLNKVGRNDPCPCGSGKKYKHCHGKLS